MTMRERNKEEIRLGINQDGILIPFFISSLPSWFLAWSITFLVNKKEVAKPLDFFILGRLVLATFLNQDHNKESILIAIDQGRTQERTNKTRNHHERKKQTKKKHSLESIKKGSCFLSSFLLAFFDSCLKHCFLGQQERSQWSLLTSSLLDVCSWLLSWDKIANK